MELNQLVLVEECLNSAEPGELTYFLVRHNLPFFDTPTDFGLALVDREVEPARHVIDDFYLVPFIDGQERKLSDIYAEIIAGEFGHDPFLRYLVKLSIRDEPELIQNKDFSMPGAVEYGSVSYGSISLIDIAGRNPEAHRSINGLLREKEKIIDKFF
jgi:hypothetical protein